LKITLNQPHNLT